MRLKQPLQLLVERRISAEARLFDLAELAVHFVERLPERLDELVHGFLARFEVALRAKLELAELGGSKLKKRAVIALQRLGRERVEGVGELRLRLVQERELLVCSAPLGCELFFIVVTSRGKVVARLAAPRTSRRRSFSTEEQAVAALRSRPWIRPGKGKLRLPRFALRFGSGEKTLAEIVREERG